MTFDLKLSEGDLTVTNGDLTAITGTEKLIQDLLKVAITPVGANPFAIWYGSLVSKTLVGSYLDDEILRGASQNQLELAITTLQKLQSQQLQAFQKLTAEEQIASILSITVERNQIEPRLFNVVISVLNRAYKKVFTSFTVTQF